MFGRRKDEKPKRNNQGRNLAQYGLFDVPMDLSVDGNGMLDDDDDDSDLEAELAAITSGSVQKPRQKPKATNVLPAAELNALVASSLRDIPSDEELSGDDDDPALLDELKELGIDHADELSIEPEPATTVPATTKSETDIRQLLDDRLKMYVTAEENAKKAGETSRARRFNRGIKTLKDLIKQANSGRAINNDDIPPEVSVNVANRPAPPPPSAPTVSETEITNVNMDTEPDSKPATTDADTGFEVKSETKPVDQNLLNLLMQRRDQYKLAAVKTKRSGDVSTAINYMKIAKQFDAVIRAVENGETVDLSQMPGPPPPAAAAASSSTSNNNEKKEESEMQNNTETVTGEVGGQVEEEEEAPQEQLITAGSVLEALEQRLQVYKAQEESAKSEGNSSKARRMGRIVKQFDQAIKSHKAGKPIPIDELPTPPGYAPIPVPNSPSQNSIPAPGAVAPSSPPPLPPVPPRPAPSSDSQPAPGSRPTPPPRVLPRGNSVRQMGNHISNTHLEKQVAMLMARQKEFKEAALTAKKKGEIAQAKELLRTAKGFDKVIDAARGGFPVDMESLPVPPSSRSVLDESYEIVIAEECKEDDTGTLEMLNRLEEQLTKQLKMCLSTRDHHKALGDVTGVNRFENLALTVTRDLDIVRLAYKRAGNVPNYHYESKSFSIVKCYTDLNDNDLELVIVRGINYNCANPKDIDTYVKIEFPYPQEDTYKERTTVIKDTNNPEYNATYTIPIHRTSRQCLRVFKRHSIKLEVYSRGGFFRSDQLLGTVQIKLQQLETLCEIHDSFDLMDGRKKVGGKLEVKVRVRHPLVAQQVEQLNEKWLVLNH